MKEIEMKKIPWAYVTSTFGWLAMGCWLMASTGCANLFNDTEAKTEIEIIACYRQVEVNYEHRMIACEGKPLSDECPSGEALRELRELQLDDCENFQ